MDTHNAATENLLVERVKECIGLNGNLDEYIKGIITSVGKSEISLKVLDAIESAAEAELDRIGELPMSVERDLAFISFRRDYGNIASRLMMNRLKGDLP